MSRDIVSIGMGHSVSHAARMMLEQGISGLPVLDDDGKLIGIVTEGDLMRRLEFPVQESRNDKEQPLTEEHVEDYIRHASWKAADCMSTTMITVDENTPVNRIASLMQANEIKRVPVMKNSRMIGIVSRADLLACILNNACDRSSLDDAAIHRSIVARLQNDLHIGPDAIEVAVSKGRVAFKGEVATGKIRQAATVLAELVPGVCGVDNELTVHGKAEH